MAAKTALRFGTPTISSKVGQRQARGCATTLTLCCILGPTCIATTHTRRAVYQKRRAINVTTRHTHEKQNSTPTTLAHLPANELAVLDAVSLGVDFGILDRRQAQVRSKHLTRAKSDCDQTCNVKRSHWNRKYNVKIQKSTTKTHTTAVRSCTLPQRYGSNRQQKVQRKTKPLRPKIQRKHTEIGNENPTQLL